MRSCEEDGNVSTGHKIIQVSQPKRMSYTEQDEGEDEEGKNQY